MCLFTIQTCCIICMKFTTISKIPNTSEMLILCPMGQYEPMVVVSNFLIYFGTFCRRINFGVGECIWNMYLRVPVLCATSWCRLCKFELVSESSRALQGMSLLVHFQRNKYVTLYRLAAVTYHAPLTLLSTLKSSVIVVIVICVCHGSSIYFWRRHGEHTECIWQWGEYFGRRKSYK